MLLHSQLVHLVPLWGGVLATSLYYSYEFMTVIVFIVYPGRSLFDEHSRQSRVSIYHHEDNIMFN